MDGERAVVDVIFGFPRRGTENTENHAPKGSFSVLLSVIILFFRGDFGDQASQVLSVSWFSCSCS